MSSTGRHSISHRDLPAAQASSLFSSIYLLYSDYIDVLFAQRRTLFHFVWRDVVVYGGDENLPAKALGERIERGKNISLALVMPTFR